MAEEAVKQQIALRKLECEETMNASSILSGVYCRSRFDGWSCWPDTPAGSTANQSCPDFMIGFDPTRKAFHKCETTGEWFQHPQYNKTWANYTTCVNVEDFEFRKQINLVYSVGYGISLVALLISLALLTYFKSLRCARITVHMNLFASFAINNFLWLLWYTFVVNDTDVVSANMVSN